MMASISRQRGSAFGLMMVAATIILLGIVAFRFIDAQKNTEVADTKPATSQVTTVAKAADIDKATAELDTADLDANFEAELDAELDF